MIEFILTQKKNSKIQCNRNLSRFYIYRSKKHNEIKNTEKFSIYFNPIDHMLNEKKRTIKYQRKKEKKNDITYTYISENNSLNFDVLLLDVIKNK